MRILYVFPHPDDESFGPARAIAAQVRTGHEIFLLTLTRGGATKQRHRLGLSVAEMGEVRLGEMRCVANALGLADLTVLDLPDSGLKDLDPRVIEAVVADHIEHVQPEIVVTYAVHGVSGFPDHLVIHAIVKRVFCELRDRGATYLKRLAFYTLTEHQARSASNVHRLHSSKPEEIGCLISAADEDIAANQRALDCYETYREMIEQTGVRESLGDSVAFELFGETHAPPLTDLAA